MILFEDKFAYPDGIITNEFATYNPSDPNSASSPLWQANSGSLLCSGGKGWTGIPDSVGPNAKSTNGNNSAVFRLTSRRADFENVSVSFGLVNKGLVATQKNPLESWSGVHIFVRFVSEESLYYVSVNRRDNTVIIKKKVPGGVSNGGSYHELTPYIPYKVPLNASQSVKTTIQTNSDKSVSIQLFVGGTLVVHCTDDGKVGGPPILGPGKVGIRGDGCHFTFDNFVVESYAPEPKSITIPAGSQITIIWK